MKYTDFHELVRPYVQSAELREMHKYKAHGKTSVFEHCYLVAKFAYRVCRILPFYVDINSVVTGAMLHDYYLYDWHIEDPNHKWHGKTHGHTAYVNASKIFSLTEKEKNIIEAHMWPENFKVYPKSKEAVIVSLSDKIQASIELIYRVKPKLVFDTI